MSLFEILIILLGAASAFLLIAFLPAYWRVLLDWIENSPISRSGIIPDESTLLGHPREQVQRITITGSLIIALLVWLMSGNLIFGLMVFAIILFIPRWIHGYLRQARLIEFEERLPATLDQMSSSAKAGLSLAQAIEEIGRSGVPPVSDEFATMAREHQLGADLSKTILNARARINSKSFNLVASALLVNIEKGGNLPEALVTLSASLKEVWRLEQKMITSSSEGRKAMWVISGVPIFIAVLVFALQPDLADALTSGILGIAIFISAIGVYLLGLYWLRSILSQEI